MGQAATATAFEIAAPVEAFQFDPFAQPVAWELVYFPSAYFFICTVALDPRLRFLGVGISCLWVRAAAVLRALAGHLVGDRRVYKARSLLFVHLTCLWRAPTHTIRSDRTAARKIPTLGFPHNEDAGLVALEALEAKLKGYDAILSRQKYLAGDVRVH